MTTDANLNGRALSAAVPEAVVLSVGRQLVGRRRFTRASVPGRPGSWTFPEQPGDRNLILPVQIQAAGFEARRAAVRELATWCDLPEPSRLIIDDEPDRYHDALLEDQPDTGEWLISAEIPLRFITGPYALALALSLEQITAAGSPDAGTFTIPDQVTAEPVIEITPTNGTMTSFTLTVNGNVLTWEGALAVGETITVSSISSTVTLGANEDVNLTGAFDEADVDMADVSGAFPLLVEGLNEWSFAWTGTATEVSLDFTWRESFR